MKRLAFALVFVASNAHAAKLDAIPSTESPLEVTSVFARWSEPFDKQCMLATTDKRAIFLRWIPEESMVQRSIISMYVKDAGGTLERQEPQWAYEPIVRVESVTKAPAVKIAEREGTAVWAYRESNAAIVFVPGQPGEVLASSLRTGTCAMATAIVSTKPASECKTMSGCGRLALLTTKSGTITLGFGDELAARITARK